MNAIDFWKGIDDRTAEITDAYNQATEENSCDYELCKACGGMCCKIAPCGLSPEQVKNILGATELNIDNLRELLNTGEYSLDYWCEINMEYDVLGNNNNSWYFIRYRSTGAQIADYEYDGSGCIHLTPTGCDLSFNKRGIDAQLLKPNGSDISKLNCDSILSKRDMGVIWLRYAGILEKLWNEFAELWPEYDEAKHIDNTLKMLAKAILPENIKESE